MIEMWPVSPRRKLVRTAVPVTVWCAAYRAGTDAASNRCRKSRGNVAGNPIGIRQTN
jgi:hypothetical protein